MSARRYRETDADGQWRVLDTAAGGTVANRPTGGLVVDEHGNSLLSSRREARSLADDWEQHRAAEPAAPALLTWTPDGDEAPLTIRWRGERAGATFAEITDNGWATESWYGVTLRLPHRYEQGLGYVEVRQGGLDEAKAAAERMVARWLTVHGLVAL